MPFVCGANLGEALRRNGEGAAMNRAKGEPGTPISAKQCGTYSLVMGEIRQLQGWHPKK
ncbi:hypothetical protein [Sporolituus thermophilus]|uniref:hypothetical protein n=1 Tax=Sporolituus thermophilus TaxID=608505 RepID=UPI000B89B883